ncbi:uncharacterized protein LOC144527774 [Sander vitreus]
MNTWPGIKGRPRPATLATTKGRWALAWGQVLHTARDRPCRWGPHSCVRESADLRVRDWRPACAAGTEPAEVGLQSFSAIGAKPKMQRKEGLARNPIISATRNEKWN